LKLDALGARRLQVIGLVLRDTVAMLIAGVVIDMILALLAGRTASALLFELKPWDLATLTVAFVMLSAIALLASLLPALRASRLDFFERVCHMVAGFWPFIPGLGCVQPWLVRGLRSLLHKLKRPSRRSFDSVWPKAAKRRF
jgi:hypothetical protein